MLKDVRDFVAAVAQVLVQRAQPLDEGDEGRLSEGGVDRAVRAVDEVEEGPEDVGALEEDLDREILEGQVLDALGSVEDVFEVSEFELHTQVE